MSDSALDGPHWRFALRLYGLPGVAEACLKLQDRLGVDVNILLLSAYAAVAHGICLDTDDLRDMDAVVAPWRAGVVAELRAVRRRLKVEPAPAAPEAAAALRQQVKSAELLAEQIEQAALAAWLDRRATGRPRSHVDVGRALREVVGYFAGRSSAAADAAEADDIGEAVGALVKAACR
jgi:uncharacterized protein (TIGR02444 family)